MSEDAEADKAKSSNWRAAGKAATKAAGITLFSAGGVAIGKDAHIFDNGVVNIDSLVHLELGGQSSSTKISDGGAALNCNPRWSIGPFALNKNNYLEKDQAPATDAGSGKDLALRAQEVAKTIKAEAPSGPLLLLGSTDPLTKREANYNVGLAADRALKVQSLLQEHFGTERSVMLGNDELRQNVPDDGKTTVGNGLARMIFGREETSGRSVMVCVLEPQPHKVETGIAASAGTNFLAGLSFGAGLFVILAIAVAAWSAWKNRADPV